MRAGAMDRRITIETQSSSRDSYGGVTESFSTLVTSLPAQIVHKKGGEVYETAQRDGTVEKTFRIRWRADVSVRDRIKFTTDRGITEIYDIIDIKEFGRREALEITGVAQVNA